MGKFISCGQCDKQFRKYTLILLLTHIPFPIIMRFSKNTEEIATITLSSIAIIKNIVLIIFAFIECFINKSFINKGKIQTKITPHLNLRQKFFMIFIFFVLFFGDLLEGIIIFSIIIFISYGNIYAMNIIILFLISKKKFGKKYYRHQNFSMMIIIINYRIYILKIQISYG